MCYKGDQRRSERKTKKGKEVVGTKNCVSNGKRGVSGLATNRGKRENNKQ